MSAHAHPQDETLVRFALGRLERKSMARVEGHLRTCSRCAQVAMRVPDDRLVRLLRASFARTATDSPHFKGASVP